MNKIVLQLKFERSDVMGYDIRTDMAVELQQIQQLDEIRGVKEEKFSENGINITLSLINI